MSGTPVSIAVIDSGIQAGHPHLSGVSVEAWVVAAEGGVYRL